jgi:Ser/Thr protein kinase RdoA (MazF antagonist)
VADREPTDLFLALTPERVLAAVEAGGVRSSGLCYPLNSFENRVYEVELTDRSRVVAKFYRPGRWSEEQVLEEHGFLRELAAEEIPVAPAREFPGGGTLRREGHILYALFDRRGGRAPDELDAPLAQRLGRLVARLHNVAVRGEARHRLALTGDDYARVDLDWLQDAGRVPAPVRRRYFDAAYALADLYDELATGVATHRLHGDLHLGNLLLRGDLLWLVDFDDMMVGPAVQDLWLAVGGRDRESLALREELLAGYEEIRAFDRSTLRLIEALRGLRMVHYAAWLARRFHDPIFPRTWPHFGTEDYWQRETEGLEEQLEVARTEADPGAERGEEPPPLTNRDYFWDWEKE